VSVVCVRPGSISNATRIQSVSILKEVIQLHWCKVIISNAREAA